MANTADPTLQAPHYLHYPIWLVLLLPFRIPSALEHFQKRMSKILKGLEGVQCQMDHVLIFGKDREEHDIRLTAALKRIQTAGATLEV